ncbi:MAG: hypothetical protein ACLS66_10280 [Weissella confusa]
MNEINKADKEYLTPDEANAQIEQFIKERGRFKSDKNEIGAFLIENGLVSGRLSKFDDLPAFLNSLTNEYTYTNDDLKHIEPLCMEDIEQGHTRRLVLDEKR